MNLRPGSNLPEYSVSQLADRIKGTLEEAFSRARVRGEISGFFQSAAGHLYWTLKDRQNGIKCACFRSAAQRLAVRPEDGLEVVVTGRVSTYGQRSEYQLLVEAVEVAGEGALLKMINDRRQRLAAEGLFDQDRKRPIPYLPSVIGVVTSERGAVIHDILHRLRERFPREVILWPAQVQGDGAAEQVAEGIAFFNRLRPRGPVPRPDVLIVGRGGGSVEDLMAFNEEAVARAIAASAIPVISAVGHETDTTIADFAADLRAPTPTAAAEMAVPVRSELRTRITAAAARLADGLRRSSSTRLARLDAARQLLERPSTRIERLAQRVDHASSQAAASAGRRVIRLRAAFAETSARLPTPREQLRIQRTRTAAALSLARRSIATRTVRARLHLDLSADETRLRALVEQRFTEKHRRWSAQDRIKSLMERRYSEKRRRWTAQARLLEASSHKRVLERGYAIVRSESDALVRRARELAAGQAVTLLFQDSPPGAPTPARIVEPSVPEPGRPPGEAVPS